MSGERVGEVDGCVKCFFEGPHEGEHPTTAHGEITYGERPMTDSQREACEDEARRLALDVMPLSANGIEIKRATALIAAALERAREAMCANSAVDHSKTHAGRLICEACRVEILGTVRDAARAEARSEASQRISELEARNEALIVANELRQEEAAKARSERDREWEAAVKAAFGYTPATPQGLMDVSHNVGPDTPHAIRVERRRLLGELIEECAAVEDEIPSDALCTCRSSVRTIRAWARERMGE